MMESLRRERKWSVLRIHRHLLGLGHRLYLRTVIGWQHRWDGLPADRPHLGGDNNLRRPPRRIRAAWPGQVVHLDVQKMGKIPAGAG
jgi:hypothetical protein